MRIRSVLVGVIGLTVAACGSTPVAAPVTSRVTSVVTSAVTATATETATESVTETVAGPTETIAGPNVTVLKTVTKAAPPAQTKMVTETATITADPVTVTAAGPAPQNPAPAASGSTFPDGSYLIGKEMPAGNYTAVGTTADCFWFIYDAAHNATDAGTGRIASVPATGYSFESTGCGTWSPAG